MDKIPVTIFLEKGLQFDGFGFGDFSQPRGGEFVFCTAMTGIEESLTDPSFAKQILVSTVAHVGNTGFTGEDAESSKIWAEGLICRHLESQPSSWRAKSSIAEWMTKEGRFAVEGIDTRALTVFLRENGSQRGIVFKKGSLSESQARTHIEKNVAPMEGQDLTKLVTCEKAFSFLESEMPFGYWPMREEFPKARSEKKPNIAVWDFGVKNNTLRILTAMGAQVRVMPATAKAEELLEAGQEGIFLSNGPGDPAAAGYIIQELKKLLGKKPIFAICLGHQLVAHALGAKTYKMKFGHRGIHHPVVQKDANGRSLRAWITSQNHGFAVDRESLPASVHVSFEHGDDGTVEGLSLPQYRCETVQFHPEAGPGPVDSCVLIKNFVLEGMKA